MVQSLSWEANWFPASQEIPRITRNPKVHYRTHKFIVYKKEGVVGYLDILFMASNEWKI